MLVQRMPVQQSGAMRPQTPLPGRQPCLGTPVKSGNAPLNASPSGTRLPMQGANQSNSGYAGYPQAGPSRTTGSTRVGLGGNIGGHCNAGTKVPLAKKAATPAPAVSWVPAAPEKLQEKPVAAAVNRTGPEQLHCSSSMPVLAGRRVSLQASAAPMVAGAKPTSTSSSSKAPIVIRSEYHKEFAEAKLPKKFFKNISKMHGGAIQPRGGTQPRPSFYQSRASAEIENIWDDSDDEVEMGHNRSIVAVRS